MSNLTVAQQQGLNIALAARAILEAKILEFEAKTYVGQGQDLRDARDACHDALDAMLDAKSRLTVLARN